MRETGTEAAVGFIAMANLSVLLSNLLNTIYTLKSLERITNLPMEILFRLMEEFEERLRVFQEVHMRRAFAGGEMKVDSSGSLILAFHTIEIVLYRAILRVLPIGCPGFLGVRERARVVICRVLGFVENLGTERLRAFWWSRKFSSHSILSFPILLRPCPLLSQRASYLGVQS